MNEISFIAGIIEKVEINSEIASDCKLRSKFVHDKFLQSRFKISENSIILIISEEGVRILKSGDQMLLSSHSIQRISYSACDRINQLFALVLRSCEVSRGQFCYIFRMNNSEEADSVNRYFGMIFKKLHHKKKERRSKSSNSIVENRGGDIHKEDNTAELSISRDNEFEDSRQEAPDPMLSQISTSNIWELVSEKHNLRRLSLCVLTSDLMDLELNNQDQPLHSSLEKKNVPMQNNNALPFLRRKKPDYKNNRISSVIERLSFRSSREMSSDFMKSGSPVVALKEQLEYEDLLSASSSLDSEKFHEPNIRGVVPRSQSKKQLLPSHSNLYINNDSKAPLEVLPNLVRKNSAPICKQLEEEQPPVPPVRIHSLRNTSFPKSLNITQTSQLTRGCGEGAALVMPEHDYNDNNDDDHFSSITTPSSCGNMESITFGIYNEPPQSSRMFQETSKISQGNIYLPSKVVNSSLGLSNINAQSYFSEVPMQYFRDFTKDEAMAYLLNKEVGCFLLRYSASHHGCMALSVKVADIMVSHYIIQQTTVGFQLKGLDHKTWPNIQSLITHLSVIPEMLPCPIIIAQPNMDRKNLASATYYTGELSKNVLAQNKKLRQTLPQSQSADDEYQERMKHFLNDTPPLPNTQDHYQQLSDFSSIIASLDSA